MLNLSPRIAQALEDGIEKGSFEALIAEELGVELSDPRVEIQRMNIVGSLRSMGYRVSGGRGGGKIYQILEWREPEPPKTVDDWPPGLQESLRVYRETLRVQSSDRRGIDATLSIPLHEGSFGYIWSYELARDVGRMVSPRAIAIERFVTRPRQRLFALDRSDLGALLELARGLVPLSTTRVHISGLLREDALQLKTLEPRGELSRRVEAVVDLTQYSQKLSRRRREMIRKAHREIHFVGGPDSGPQLRVLELWKQLNLSKHRQPALTRDVVAMESDFYPFVWTGFRGDDPVSVVICDRLPPPNDYIATLIVEKSLNYSTVPGGHSGTSDGALTYAMEQMRLAGITHFNLGAYEGGGVGLPEHKLHFADPRDDVECFSFYLPQQEETWTSLGR